MRQRDGKGNPVRRGRAHDLGFWEAARLERASRICGAGRAIVFALGMFLSVLSGNGSADAQLNRDELRALTEDIRKRTEELRELIKKAEALQEALRRAQVTNEEAQKGTTREEPGEKEAKAPSPQLPVTFKGLVQTGWIGRLRNPGTEPESEFLVKEAQLSVEGSVVPRTSFFVEANFSEPGEEVRLNDAFATLELSNAVSLIGGQLRVPLNRPAVSARTALFLAEPRASGPVQAGARDRGVNLVFTPFDGRLRYEQALVNGNGIKTNRLGNDDSDLLLEGRLIWFATGKWPLPLPAQTDFSNSPWSTFFKVGWASGEFEKNVTATSREKVRENTWNVGQAIVGRGLYTYWQYGQALADGTRDFDSTSFFVTSGYVFPLRRVLPVVEAAPKYVSAGWLEPKLQYETLRFDDPTLFNRPHREIYRFGINYYPFGTPNIRLMAEHEVVLHPARSDTFFLFFHYMF